MTDQTINDSETAAHHASPLEIERTIVATPTRVEDIPPLAHSEAMRLAAVEYERFTDQLRLLSEEEWSLPTDCDEWDVQAMTQHVLGAMEGNASMRENLKQMRAGAKWAKVNNRPLADGLAAVQIAERADITGKELSRRVGAAAPGAVKGRSRIPAPMRNLVRMTVEVPGITEKWKLGYLVDIIYTRDAWMHRVDIARATGRELVLTDAHDGRLIAEIVAEWARRHGEPCTLVLSGPAGGRFVQGEGGPTIELDAVEFARIVSKREEGSGLLAQAVPF